jgi:hypothetical protein
MNNWISIEHPGRYLKNDGKQTLVCNIPVQLMQLYLFKTASKHKAKLMFESHTCKSVRTIKFPEQMVHPLSPMKCWQSQKADPLSEAIWLTHDHASCVEKMNSARVKKDRCVRWMQRA